MVKVINTAAQTIQPGQAVTFNKLISKTGCGECYNDNTNTIRLRGGCNSVYTVGFGANVGAVTAGDTVELSLSLGGYTIAESTAKFTAPTANVPYNLFRAIPIQLCCGDFDRLALVNTGTTPINIDVNVVLFAKREG